MNLTKILNRSALLWVALVLFSVSCNSDQPSSSTNEDGDQVISYSNGDGEEVNIKVEGMEDLGAAVKELSDKVGNSAKDLNISVEKDGEKVEAVDFRDLKKLLPERVAGLDRTEASGSKNGMFGMSISNAEGKYRDGDQRLEVSITDTGGMSMLVSSMAGWTSFEVDKESDTGFERTTEINGHKAFVNYNTKSQRGSIAVLVADRFIVNVEGSHMDYDDLEDAVDDLNLRRLARQG